MAQSRLVLLAGPRLAPRLRLYPAEAPHGGAQPAVYGERKRQCSNESFGSPCSHIGLLAIQSLTKFVALKKDDRDLKLLTSLVAKYSTNIVGPMAGGAKYLRK